SPRTRSERLFLVWMAPRGVVAAAVSSVFALVLVEAGRPEAGELVPITFLVIAVTVAIYGLTAAPVARRLGLAEPEPQGLLLIGAHAFAREIAGALQKHGFRVLLADTNRVNVRAARSADLTVFHGNVLADPAAEQIDLAGIGRLLALTPNDEVNALAALHFADLFERSQSFQLVPTGAENEGTRIPGLRGRALFSRRATYQGILRRMEAGAIIREITLSEPFDLESFRRTYGEDAIALFLVRRKKNLTVCAADQTTASAPGDILIALAKPVKEDSAGEVPLPKKS
ncbi:MAG: NAD-binding protein, partial [Gemmatimonadetes bacterium]|nr:NAD-binding protein [Gemmatimonadota bacterium]